MASAKATVPRIPWSSPPPPPIKNYSSPAMPPTSALRTSSNLCTRMNDKKVILQTIIGQGILPLFYWESPSVCLEVMRTLYRAGVRAIEYTNRGTAALDNFTMLKKTLAVEAPDLYLGIGTIKSAAEAKAFIKAGADFIIAPIVNPEVAAVAAESDMLWIPGCMPPTEIYTAQQLKAAAIKIFPANIVG